MAGDRSREFAITGALDLRGRWADAAVASAALAVLLAVGADSADGAEAFAISSGPGGGDLGLGCVSCVATGAEDIRLSGRPTGGGGGFGLMRGLFW